MERYSSSTVTSSIPSPSSQASAPSSKVGRSEGYGRSILDSRMKAVYDILAKSALNGTQKVDLPLVTGEELNRVLTYVQRDYPELYRLKSQYTYLNNAAMNNTTVTLEYEAPDSGYKVADISAAASNLLQSISPELSDFDKAVIVHDRLVLSVSYNQNAPRANLLSGALCDKAASCDGYAKAYQYLLQQLGIQALIVYGDANGGPHAWNVVRLDGEYYNTDITWDDAVLNDGTPFLSHEYLFLNDSYFGGTHSPKEDGSNYPLPKCVSMRQNFFIKNGIMLTALTQSSLEEKVEKALNLAVANRNTAVQIGFVTTTLGSQVDSSFIKTGFMDSFLQKKASQKDVEATGRALSSDSLVLTYIIKYKD